MELTDLQTRFILHWGEMGARWGINRTVAQIHALLFLSPKPLDAEEIATTLDVARSNVSNSLRELQAYQIVKTVHVMGERRDHFESIGDVWEMFRRIADERKRREFDPTIAMLRVMSAEAKKSSEAHTGQRLSELLQCFELFGSWYDSTRRLSTPAVVKLCKLGSKISRLLGLEE